MSKKAVIEVTPQVHRQVSARAKKSGVSRKRLACSLLTDGLARIDSGDIKIDASVISKPTEES